MVESIPFRTIVKFTGLAIALLFVLAYAVFQARFLISGPQISLTESLDFRQNVQQISLTGKTYNISRLWLNDRPIYTDAKGNFNETLVLENGYTIATLRAKDRYGRETTVTKQFMYTPASFIE